MDLFRATKSCCPTVPAVPFYLVGTVRNILFVKLQLNLRDISLNKFKSQNIMSTKHKCRECSKLIPQFRLYTCILSGAVVTFGLVRFLTFGTLKVCYDIDIFQPMKIHVSKIMNLQRCKNEILVFIGFYLDNTSH